MRANLRENHKLGIENHKLEDTESLLHWVDVYVEVHDVNSAYLSAVEMHSVIRLETKLRMPLPWLQIAQSNTLLDTNPGLDLKSIQPRPVGKVREGRKERISWSLGARKRLLRHGRVLIVERTNRSATLISQINICDHNIESMIQNLKMFFQILQNTVWQIKVMWLFLHTLMHCRQ